MIGDNEIRAFRERCDGWKDEMRKEQVKNARCALTEPRESAESKSEGTCN